MTDIPGVAPSRESTTQRKKGRPSKRDGDPDARERLVEAARAKMRIRPRVSVPRRKLALSVGVTPGLVTYYFATELSLVEAAARPIIDGYLARLKTLLAEEPDPEVALRSLILLFLEISRDNGQLLDSYITFVKDQNVGASGHFLAASFVELNAFLERCENAGVLRSVNSPFFQTYVWGVCKTVAQSSELAALLASAPGTAEGLADQQADMIMDLLLRGAVKPCPAT